MSTRALATGKAPARAAFDLDRAWKLDDRVAVRAEPFGALMYHYGTRRLSFLKSPVMLEVVRSLRDHPSARQACREAGVAPGQLDAYARALAELAASQMIIERSVR